MIIQLHDPIPVVTPLGTGYAVIMEAQPNDNYWTVILEDGAFVTFTQQKIRAARSYTHHRIPDAEMREILEKANGRRNHSREAPSGETASVAGRGRDARLSGAPAPAHVQHQGVVRRKARRS